MYLREICNKNKAKKLKQEHSREMFEYRGGFILAVIASQVLNSSD